VTVLARAVGLPAATVQLEPIRDPRVFVHNYSRPFGNWQSIVSARPLSRDQWRHGTTADNGRCTFADLSPGYWVCRSLGIDKLFRVQPGQHSDLRIDAPENTTILHGVVLARDGAPIPDAPIWKLNRRIRSASVIVAHSDQNGRFSAAVCPLATLGAFHPGLAPVAVTVPQARGSQQRHVVLQFREAGAQLTGRVLDASGRPRARGSSNPSTARVVTPGVPGPTCGEAAAPVPVVLPPVAPVFGVAGPGAGSGVVSQPGNSTRGSKAAQHVIRRGVRRIGGPGGAGLTDCTVTRKWDSSRTT